MNDIYGIGWG